MNIDISDLNIICLDGEIWRCIVGVDGYLVSNMGRVISLKRTPRLLVLHPSFGYLVVSLPVEKGKMRNKSVHRLVCDAFLDEPIVKMQVNHKNGIRNDNRLCNLEWMTPSQNTQHSFDYLRGRNIPKLGIEIKKIIDIKGEIWKKVIGFEGYEVSNYGRVKSCCRISKNGSKLKEKILMSALDVQGYIKYSLYLNGKKKTVSQHRLIANAFIENPDNKPQVNHINGVRDDNRIENLEWNTISENIVHSYKVLKRKSNGGLKDASCKKVAAYDLNGFLVKKFKSASDAKRYFGIKGGSFNACCSGKLNKDKNGKYYKTTRIKGYMFLYYKDIPLEHIDPYVKIIGLGRSRKVKLFSEDEIIIQEFETVKDCANYLNLQPSRLSNRLKNNKNKFKNFIIKYS